LVVVCAAVPGLAPAQTAAPTVDTNLVIIPTRSPDAVQADIDNAQKAKSDADVRRSVAQSLKDASDAKVDVAEKEIEVIDKKRDLAKKEKRDADVAAFEIQKTAARQAKDLLERQRDLRQAELDVVKAEVDFASAAKAAYDLELQLMKKRLELAKSAGSGNPEMPLAALQQAMRELEGRTLKAQKEMADKQTTTSERQESVIERRLKLFETQSKLSSGK
jgi:hypothetical protein